MAKWAQNGREAKIGREFAQSSENRNKQQHLAFMSFFFFFITIIIIQSSLSAEMLGLGSSTIESSLFACLSSSSSR